jgi:hypothetical protein
MPLESLLSRQAGVISREQAIASGLSRDAVDHRLRTRRWRPLHPRVYLVDGHRYDDEARVRAAVLWAGAGAVLSGTAAAWWHGMVDEAPATVGMTVPRRRCPRPRPGVDVRHRKLASVDVLRCRGLLVTAPPLAVIEAAIELGVSAGAELLDRALQQCVTLAEVHGAYRRSLGTQGSTTAGRALAAAAHRWAGRSEIRREVAAGSCRPDRLP